MGEIKPEEAIAEEERVDWNKTRVAACIVEFIGTFCIIFFGGWAYLQFEKSPKNFNWTAVAICQGLFQAICVWGGQAISGGHFNWAVTIALAGLKKIPPGIGAWYLGAQTAGSFLAAFLVDFLTPASYDQGTKTSMGIPQLDKTYGETVGFFCEMIATGFYMYVVMAFNFDRRNSKSFYGLAAGGASIVAILSIGPVTGGAINPARIVGPILVTFMSDNTKIYDDLHHYWFYFIGPIFAALLIGFYYEYFVVVTIAEEAELMEKPLDDSLMAEDAAIPLQTLNHN
jgi:glycerol uptake facilitator-like aquaporin